MDPIEKRELKRKAWMRLAAQRRRAGILRGRVVVLSLICFAILWAAVFAQMITGHDPVLAGKGSTARTRPVASTKEPVEESATAEAEEAEALEVEAEVAEFEEPLVTSQS